MRTNISDRYYRTLTYQAVDRVPDIEFGYWPQTIRRWLKEGMALELTPDEQNAMFLQKLDDFLGLDRIETEHLWLNVNLNPAFEEIVLEQREHSTIVRDAMGCTAERFLHSQEESSIPHYIKFAVETPDDWKALKERLVIDDPARTVTPATIEKIRQAASFGKMITCWPPGPYGWLRHYIGFENLSIAFYEYPQMIHEMVEHITEMSLHQLRQIPLDVPLDYSLWWEDMACKNGPFVGPTMFREFLQPCYRAVMRELRKHGACISMVDCDGNPHDIVANWLEEGVNIMFPLEVAAGCDPFAWRKEFGNEMRIRGAIDKPPLVEGGAAIDRELERIKPLLDQGGFIPHVDHVIPPNISYKNFRDYLDKKRKLIGK
ncbi:MAG: uroporphyrinogen decarboxylase family protein [Phycisphaerae bacterium]|nr:uroporphyrinogen decarboxylase family protein [Phycisphaerae bacterium]